LCFLVERTCISQYKDFKYHSEKRNYIKFCLPVNYIRIAFFKAGAVVRLSPEEGTFICTYIFNSLSRWSGGLEKLTIAQLLNIFRAFYGIRSFITKMSTIVTGRCQEPVEARPRPNTIILT
jgi:hypothetical protein